MPSGLILPKNSIGSAAKMFRILLLSLYLNVEISDNLKALPNSPRCVVGKRVGQRFIVINKHIRRYAPNNSVLMLICIVLDQNAKEA